MKLDNALKTTSTAVILCATAMSCARAQDKSPEKRDQEAASDRWYEEHRSEQEVMMRQMFPKAPTTVRNMNCFRGFGKGVSIFAIVEKCGRPDGEPCSGVICFFYKMDDGSRIWIGSTDINHIASIDHVRKSGKPHSLLKKNQK